MSLTNPNQVALCTESYELRATRSFWVPIPRLTGRACNPKASPSSYPCIDNDTPPPIQNFPDPVFPPGDRMVFPPGVVFRLSFCRGRPLRPVGRPRCARSQKTFTFHSPSGRAYGNSLAWLSLNQAEYHENFADRSQKSISTCNSLPPRASARHMPSSTAC
jgi:hypothetical protein